MPWTRWPMCRRRPWHSEGPWLLGTAGLGLSAPPEPWRARSTAAATGRASCCRMHERLLLLRKQSQRCGNFAQHTRNTVRDNCTTIARKEGGSSTFGSLGTRVHLLNVLLPTPAPPKRPQNARAGPGSARSAGGSGAKPDGASRSCVAWKRMALTTRQARQHGIATSRSCGTPKGGAPARVRCRAAPRPT